VIEPLSLNGLERLSEAYRLLSACFCRPELDAFLKEEVYGRLLGALEDSCPAAVPSARALRDAASSANPDELLAEYARLFVGPHALVAPPYGSVYMEPGGRVMGPSSLRVAEAYRRDGLSVDAGSNEPPDHIALELEFLSYLTTLESQAGTAGEGSETERLQQRRDDFLHSFVAPWVPEFTERILAGTEDAYFVNLARCLETLVRWSATGARRERPSEVAR
jgi:TorA maturation chaperone TorD